MLSRWRRRIQVDVETWRRPIWGSFGGLKVESISEGQRQRQQQAGLVVGHRSAPSSAGVAGGFSLVDSSSFGGSTGFRRRFCGGYTLFPGVSQGYRQLCLPMCGAAASQSRVRNRTEFSLVGKHCELLFDLIIGAEPAQLLSPTARCALAKPLEPPILVGVSKSAPITVESWMGLTSGASMFAGRPESRRKFPGGDSGFESRRHRNLVTRHRTFTLRFTH